MRPGSLISGLRGVFGAVPPLTAPPEAGSARAIAVRRRFFGDAADPDTGAVRPDRVVLSWVGCTTYAMAFAGSVFLLDAWVPRVTSSGYVPATPQDLVDLRPEAIFIGHGHFDHAGDAGTIAEASGATVHGTAEHCAAIRGQVPNASFPTVAHGDSATPVGAREDFTVGSVEVTAIRHLHSARTPADENDPAPRFFPRPQLGPILRHPPTLTHLRETVPRLLDPEGGVLLYQFRTPGFALTWHDSSGPLTEKAPDLFNTLAALPTTHVHLGAIQGYNQLTNGLRDPRTYLESLAPTVFVPGHHDNWLPGLTSSAAAYDTPLHTELARLPTSSRPDLRLMHDPTDYLTPSRLTFAL
ncbi:MBL fold metallo-hydrolase [Nocardia puris]|uniref:MBL fold metallo-hydrolase n=1 Tax=Nocardia puris TaxID=208602 RepID=UPI002E1A453D